MLYFEYYEYEIKLTLERVPHSIHMNGLRYNVIGTSFNGKGTDATIRS